MKTIWSLDPKSLGQTKQVDESYQVNPLFETEVALPTGLLIPAWDSKAQGWYDAGGGVGEKYDPVSKMVAQLLLKNASLEARVATLEGVSADVSK
ncbi:hypothetical protein ACFQ4L_10365 [Lapidilactobacillus mulanensis]|uniref:Peptidase S74 domain-containing protein n=1 Tax=Lapidilactobacillus mulanensis TaxID=2485999 RepID=A0ABW4DPA6_9LACO|nr:hypothetical protein [Lapidilactobacillus mulanensis]